MFMILMIRTLLLITDDKPCFNNEEKSECRKDHYKDNTGSIFIVVLELVFT